jgi:hypothetical protein
MDWSLVKHADNDFSDEAMSEGEANARAIDFEEHLKLPENLIAETQTWLARLAAIVNTPNDVMPPTEKFMRVIDTAARAIADTFYAEESPDMIMWPSEVIDHVAHSMRAGEFVQAFEMSGEGNEQAMDHVRNLTRIKLMEMGLPAALAESALVVPLDSDEMKDFFDAVKASVRASELAEDDAEVAAELAGDDGLNEEKSVKNMLGRDG